MLSKKLLLLLFSTLAMLLLLITPFVGAQQTETFTVDVFSSRVIIFSLDKDVELKGSFSVSGGSGNDVDFYITDPKGSRIVDLGRVSGEAAFEFTANESGAYTLRFDNGFSWFSTKTVTLNYEFEGDVPSPVIPKNVQITAAVEAAIIIGLILVGVAIAVLLKRRKNLAPV